MTRISNYEWELIEDGFFLGLTPRDWYYHLLAEGDIDNINKISKIYTPPTESKDNLIEAAGDKIIISQLQLVTDIRLLETLQNQPELIFSLKPRQFEQFTAELLIKLGYNNVVVGKGSKDGGVDVKATLSHAIGTERIIVQCKRNSPENKVGEPAVKQLYANTDLHNASRGLIVTSSMLTRPAHLLIESYSHRLSALEYEGIVKILQELRQVK